MKYRTKPIVVDAIKWDGKNHRDFIKPITRDGTPIWWDVENERITIIISRNTFCAEIGDYIVEGILGEFYPVQQYIFEASHEKIEEK